MELISRIFKKKIWTGLSEQMRSYSYLKNLGQLWLNGLAGLKNVKMLLVFFRITTRYLLHMWMLLYQISQSDCLQVIMLKMRMM